MAVFAGWNGVVDLFHRLEWRDGGLAGHKCGQVTKLGHGAEHSQKLGDFVDRSRHRWRAENEHLKGEKGASINELFEVVLPIHQGFAFRVDRMALLRMYGK